MSATRHLFYGSSFRRQVGAGAFEAPDVTAQPGVGNVRFVGRAATVGVDVGFTATVGKGSVALLGRTPTVSATSQQIQADYTLPTTTSTLNVTPSTPLSTINGADAGARINFAAGTYNIGTIIPKAGQVYNGNVNDPGSVVFHGQGQNKRFISGGVPDVWLQGFTITQYASGAGTTMTYQPLGHGGPGTNAAHQYQMPVIDADHSTFQQGGGFNGPAVNWTLYKLILHENYCTGATMGPGWKIGFCEFYRHGHKAIGANGANLLLEHSTLRNNGLFQASETEDVAGIKITGGASDGGAVTGPNGGGKIRYCHIHDNWGEGIWFDFNVPDWEIHNCSIYRNGINAIRWEASARHYLHDCQLGDNQQRPFMYNGPAGGGADYENPGFLTTEFSFQNSKLCLVENNTIVSKRRRVMFIGQQSRSENMPQGGRHIGHFTATRNTIRNNLFLVYNTDAECDTLFIDTHACSNNSPNCGSPTGTITGACSTTGSGAWAFPPRSPHIGDTPMPWSGVQRNEWCFIPQPNQNHLNVIDNNTWRHAGASIGRFANTANGTAETNATIINNQSVAQLDAFLPNWAVLPGGSGGAVQPSASAIRVEGHPPLVPMVTDPSAYAANPVHSDGTNDYMVRGADLTGTANSTSWTGSVWIRRAGGNGVLQRVFTSNGALIVIEWMFENTLRVRGHDGTATCLDIQTPPITDTNWHHIMWSVNATNDHLYVDDASNKTVAVHNSNAIDFTQVNWAAFAQVNGSSKLIGDVADLQMWFGQYRDLSLAANRRLFITTDGKPVDPATAAASLGNPIVRLSGATASWHTNKGTGGGFTLTGTLTDGVGPVQAAVVAPPTYTANPVNSDGTNDFMVRGSDLTGAVDSPNWTGSVWLRRVGGIGTLQRVLSSGGGHVLVEWRTGNTLGIRGSDGTTTVFTIDTSAVTDSNWHHYMWSSNGTTAHLFRDGVSDLTTTTLINTPIDFTHINWGVLAQVNGVNKFSGDIADFMSWHGTYVDLSQISNQRLFITADGKPVDPATAVASLGNPIILLSGATPSWHTNDGTGGGFTLTGSLTDGAPL